MIELESEYEDWLEPIELNTQWLNFLSIEYKCSWWNESWIHVDWWSKPDEFISIAVLRMQYQIDLWISLDSAD